jgi:hypothetical protein
MNQYDEESDLRGAFAADLLAEDAASTPSFEAMWDAAGRERRKAKTALRVRIACSAAAAVIIALGSFLYFHSVPVPHSEQPRTVRMSDWKASTDFLLKTPGSEILTDVPDLQPDVTVDDFKVATNKKEDNITHEER